MNAVTEDKTVTFESVNFGEITVPENKVIKIVQPMPGFESLKRYVILDHDEEGLFKWFQAVDDPAVSFLLTDPALYKNDYNVQIRKEDLNLLGTTDLSGVVVLVTVQVDTEKNVMNLNLRGPVIFDSTNMTAMQFIVDKEEYECQYSVPLQAPEETSTPPEAALNVK